MINLHEGSVSGEREQLFDSLCGQLARSNAHPAWDSLVAAGVAGLRIGEELGGLGLPLRNAEPIMAALGETCRATPFIESSVVAAGLLNEFRSAAGDQILRVMATQGAVCAVAGLDARLRDDLGARQTTAGEWTLNGVAQLVLEGASAVAILAVVPMGPKLALFLVQPGASSEQHAYPTIDGRWASDLRFSNAPAQLMFEDAAAAVSAACDEALACIAIEAAGIMRRLVRDTVEYTRARRQFGQALSEFQVIQHRLVDMNIHARRAGAIARRAMAALDQPPAARARTVSAAKATVAAAGRFVGQQAVQLHGAMGMTNDLALGRFFKRLTVIEGELGSADDHLARHASLREAD